MKIFKTFNILSIFIILGIIFYFSHKSNLNYFIFFLVISLLAILLVIIFPLNKRGLDFNKFLGYGIFSITIFIILFSYCLLLAMTESPNPDWKEIRQGVSQIIAAVVTGVVALTVAYLAYNNNRKTEEEKRDRELISSLNERFLEIVSRLRSGSNSADNRTLDFYTLAALYKDWEELSYSSELIKKQKKHHQQFIINTIFNKEITEQESRFISSMADLLFESKDRNQTNLQSDKLNTREENQISNFRNLFFNDFIVENKIFNNSDFTRYVFSRFIFKSCILNNVIFEKINPRKLEFTSCSLYNVNFPESIGTATNTEESTLQIIFNDCKIKGNFNNSECNFKFPKSTLSGSKFTILPIKNRSETSISTETGLQSAAPTPVPDSSIFYDFSKAKIKGIFINDLPIKKIVQNNGESIDPSIWEALKKAEDFQDIKEEIESYNV